MSARQGTSNSQQSGRGNANAATLPNTTGQSRILPRRRARLTTTIVNQPAVDEEDSSSLSSASDSDESTKMVAAFIGEDANDNLRINEEEKKRHNQEDEIGESTASQHMAERVKEEDALKPGGRSIDIGDYVSQMIAEETGEVPRDAGIQLFRRNPFLTISQLNDRGIVHIVRNKVSDKFNRRDVQFYDMYVKKDSADDLARLKEAQLPLEIDADLYYNDLEIEDFNKLFNKDHYIGDKFGRSIKVNLELSNPQVKRRVVEHAELVKHSEHESSPSKMSSKIGGRDEHLDDPDLIHLDSTLKQLEREFGKTTQEIADIFCKVSGRLNKMREYLEGKPSVIEWNYLEDLALTKPEESAEFQVLLRTKGMDEIKIRRDFLKVTPITNDEEEGQPQP